jgi:hypothetical protein
MKRLFLLSGLLFVHQYACGAASVSTAKEFHGHPAVPSCWRLINLKEEDVLLERVSFQGSGRAKDRSGIRRNYKSDEVYDILLQGATAERRDALLSFFIEKDENFKNKKELSVQRVKDKYIEMLPDQDLEDEAFDALVPLDVSFLYARIVTMEQLDVPEIASACGGCRKFPISNTSYLMIPSTSEVSNQELERYFARDNVKELIARKNYELLARMLAARKFCETEKTNFYAEVLRDEDGNPIKDYKKLSAVLWSEK